MEDLNLSELLKQFTVYLEKYGYAIVAKPLEVEEAIEEFLESKV